jgi:hypothetical protein
MKDEAEQIQNFLTDTPYLQIGPLCRDRDFKHPSSLIPLAKRVEDNPSSLSQGKLSGGLTEFLSAGKLSIPGTFRIRFN